MEEEKKEGSITYTKQGSPLNMKKIFAWFVVIIVLVVLISLIVSIVNTVKKNKERRIANTPVVTEEEEKEDIVVSEDGNDVLPKTSTDIVSFAREYTENGVSANTKYIGKEIETAGYIQNMTSSLADGSFFIVVIPARGGFYTDARIQCFVSGEEVFQDLKSGDIVIVKGVVGEFEFNFIPFENCSVRK